MKYPAFLTFIVLILCSIGFAQKPVTEPTAKKIPAVVPAKAAATKTGEFGVFSDRTYTNTVYGFRITFPETWSVAGPDFEESLKSRGHDISLKAPENIGGAGKLQVAKMLERVKVLVTGFRSTSGMKDTAIMRVSAEDLRTVPAVQDAVDYFDLMRSQFAVMKLPADFKYSETQAEKLGAKQFAFLDISSNAGKKRLYATVRNGYAIMFTLSFTKSEDLATMRQVLAAGDFKLQNK